MKVIDFELYGNVIKLYLGEENLDHYYGDDWNDTPYEHNAGEVYEQFVSGAIEIPIKTTHLILEPADDMDYNGNSPFCKEDFRDKNVPFVVICRNDGWWYSYSEEVERDDTIKLYFNEPLTSVLEKLDDLIIRIR